MHRCLSRMRACNVLLFCRPISIFVHLCNFAGVGQCSRPAILPEVLDMGLGPHHPTNTSRARRRGDRIVALMSPIGTNRTNRTGLTMSVDRSRAEVAGPRSKRSD